MPRYGQRSNSTNTGNGTTDSSRKRKNSGPQQKPPKERRLQGRYNQIVYNDLAGNSSASSGSSDEGSSSSGPVTRSQSRRNADLNRQNSEQNRQDSTTTGEIASIDQQAIDDSTEPTMMAAEVEIKQEITDESNDQSNLVNGIQLETNKPRLPRIGPFQIMKITDEENWAFDAIDMDQGCLMIGRRLEIKKHMRRLRLAHRLSKGADESDENRRNFELLFPPNTVWIKNKEKATDGKEEIFYYWFETPNCGSLHAYVIERKRLPENQCREYFRQICELVQYCHNRGVIIRDLKLRKFVFADQKRRLVKLDDLDDTAIVPENKSIEDDKLDWNEYDPEDDQLCDRHGCPAYISPEILDLSKKWYSGKASDVWSLGVLLYVLSVGRYPFYDVTPGGLFAKIRQARVHLTDQDGVKLEVRVLIRMMLRRDPKDRPAITEVLANPWLSSRDYRLAFKTANAFLGSCVFWKPNMIVSNAGAGVLSGIPADYYAMPPSPSQQIVSTANSCANADQPSTSKMVENLGLSSDSDLQLIACH